MNDRLAAGLFKAGFVKKIGESDNYIYFEVKKYDVFFDKRKNLWNCGCEFGSLWKGYSDKNCKHEKACKLWIQENEPTKYIIKIEVKGYKPFTIWTEIKW